MTIIYNPNNVDLYDYQEEKTDYNVFLPINLDENPQEPYQNWEKVGCHFGMFGTCFIHRYGWVTRYRSRAKEEKSRDE